VTVVVRPLAAELLGVKECGDEPHSTPVAPDDARKPQARLTHDRNGDAADFEDVVNKLRPGETLSLFRERKERTFSSDEWLFTKLREKFFETLRLRGIEHSEEWLSFADYMERIEPSTIAMFASVSWKAWGALSLLVVINGVRGIVITGSESNQTFVESSVSFVAVLGYSPLVLLMCLRFVLQMRVKKFVGKPLMRKRERDAAPWMFHPSEALLFNSAQTTMQILQIVVLGLEWYVSLYAISIAPDVFHLGYAQGAFFMIFALLPWFAMWLLLPWTVAIVGVVANLGLDLDPAVIREMLQLRTECMKKKADQDADLPTEWSLPEPLLLGTAAALPSRESPKGQPPSADSKSTSGNSRAIATDGQTNEESRFLAHQSVVRKPPPPALPPLVPKDFILPYERPFFDKMKKTMSERGQLQQGGASTERDSDEEHEFL
jgi:hypothetical protein